MQVCHLPIVTASNFYLGFTFSECSVQPGCSYIYKESPLLKLFDAVATKTYCFLQHNF